MFEGVFQYFVAASFARLEVCVADVLRKYRTSSEYRVPTSATHWTDDGGFGSNIKKYWLGFDKSRAGIDQIWDQQRPYFGRHPASWADFDQIRAHVGRVWQISANFWQSSNTGMARARPRIRSKLGPNSINVGQI